MLLRHDDVIKSKLAQGETCDVISDVDVWINNCLLRLVINCQRHQTNFELSRALEQLQHFWTSNFCDVYLVSLSVPLSTRLCDVIIAFVGIL